MLLLHGGCAPSPPPVDVPVPGGPNNIVAGDFDRDGDADLAVSAAAGGIYVLLNRGKGRFETDAAYTAAEVPWTMATGDIDGDGNPDVACPSWDGQGPLGMTVLLGRGDGSFDRLGLGERDWGGGVAIGDVDGDGFDDIVAPWADYQGHEISRGIDVIQGPDLEHRVELTYFAEQVAAGDFDGDGFADIATGDGVLLSDGDGGFHDPIPFGNDIDPYRMTTADLDDDGNLDLIFVGDERYAHVTLGDGSGQLGPVAVYEVSNHARPVVTADLDDDGHLDIAAGTYATSTRIAILYGDGGGDFPAAGAVHVSTGDPVGLAAADVDDDGDIDLVGANYDADSVSVILGPAR